jgi:hypothetical protein
MVSVDEVLPTRREPTTLTLCRLASTPGAVWAKAGTVATAALP